MLTAVKARLRNRRSGSIGARGAVLPHQEGGDEGGADGERGEHLGAGPAVAVAAHDPEDDAEQAAADQQQAGEVEVLGRAGLLGEHAAGSGDEQQPDRDVEPEDELPAGALRHRSADHRAERDGEAGGGAPDAERGAAAMRRHRRGQQRERQRHDGRSTDALQRRGR